MRSNRRNERGQQAHALHATSTKPPFLSVHEVYIPKHLRLAPFKHLLYQMSSEEIAETSPPALFAVPPAAHFTLLSQGVELSDTMESCDGR